MTYYRVLREGAGENVPRHTHDATEISGTFNFVRILKALIDGDLEISGFIRTGESGQRIEIRPVGDNLVPSIGWFTGDATIDEAAVIELTESGGVWGLVVAGPHSGTGAAGFQLRDDGVMLISSNNAAGYLLMADPIHAEDGTAAAPSIRRDATADGLFFASGVVGLTVTGTEVGRFTAGQLSLVNGDATTPALGATADTDTGVFFGTAVVGVTAAGAEVARFTGDAGNNLQGLAYTTWTPTYTNLTPGTGAVTTARYVQIGNQVHAWWSLELGTTPTVGDVIVSLPVAASSNYRVAFDLIGECHLVDEGTQAYFGAVRIESTTTVKLVVYGASATYVNTANISSTVPFTWVAGDKITFHAVYEAA